LEISCDAPPYVVVSACARHGFQSPLDVRWCRIDKVLKREEQSKGILGLPIWKWLFGQDNNNERHTCICGSPVPELKRYRFPFLAAQEDHYLLAQCRRCRTMFWDEVLALPTWMEEGEPA